MLRPEQQKITTSKISYCITIYYTVTSKAFYSFLYLLPEHFFFFTVKTLALK
jgi:hypothetical protein